MEMAPENGEPTADLIADLAENHQQYQFHQAVRLLQNSLQLKSTGHRYARVGSEPLFRDSAIQFKSLQSLSFPPGDITKFRDTTEESERQTAELTVAFLGLTGPTGVLPAHYTSLVIERCHSRHKDYALREFLDLFNHRAISLFFRASEKYKLPHVYETARYLEHREDAITQSLNALVGMGLPGLQNRFSFRDDVLIFYGGLFADRCRSAAGLEQILATFFRMTVHVQQFCIRWLFLPEASQSGFQAALGNMSLGQSAIAGSRIQEVQSLFRISIEIPRWSDFLGYLPGTSTHQQIVDLIHHYVGIDLDFEIQLTLPGKEIPPARMTSDQSCLPLLGWTTWLGQPNPEQTIGDAVFAYGFGGIQLN